MRRPLPNDFKTLPLWTTGPAAARTSASDARARNASGAPTTGEVPNCSRGSGFVYCTVLCMLLLSKSYLFVVSDLASA